MLLWTLKEAFMKAVGAGLEISPDTLRCHWSGEGEPLDGWRIAWNGTVRRGFLHNPSQE